MYTRDLHALHVAEALGEVRKWMDIFTGNHTGAPMTLRLITGRGAHSEGGCARLQPAVVDFLAQRGVTYMLAAKGGCVSVLLDDATCASWARYKREAGC